MNATEFLGVASELTAGHTEGHVRTAANRAYYAIYHCCDTLLETIPRSAEPLHTSSQSAHRRIIEAMKTYRCEELADEDVRKVRMAGRMMDAAFRIRKEADYYIEREFNRRVLPMQMDRANRIIAMAEELKARLAA